MKYWTCLNNIGCRILSRVCFPPKKALTLKSPCLLSFSIHGPKSKLYRISYGDFKYTWYWNQFEISIEKSWNTIMLWLKRINIRLNAWFGVNKYLDAKTEENRYSAIPFSKDGDLLLYFFLLMFLTKNFLWFIHCV